MTAKRTRLGITDLCFPELERAVESALTGLPAAGAKGGKARCAERFQREMESVLRGIEVRSRFQLLKRFIAHGSLLPPWEHKFINSPQALNDDELAACMDFVLGHMISKFQGKLAEMLAIAPLGKLVLRLKREGRLPVNGQMVFGNDLR